MLYYIISSYYNTYASLTFSVFGNTGWTKISSLIFEMIDRYINTNVQTNIFPEEKFLHYEKKPTCKLVHHIEHQSNFHFQFQDHINSRADVYMYHAYNQFSSHIYHNLGWSTPPHTFGSKLVGKRCSYLNLLLYSTK